MSTPARALAANGPWVDLHLHSTASDGADPPARVVEIARAAGASAIALTDHDTVDGVATAADAGTAAGVHVVAGVELSAYEDQDEAHLLGLHLVQLAELHEHLAAFRVARRQRAEEMVRRLNDIGVRITFEDVLSVAGDAAIGRPHVARALVENGWAHDLRDAFDRYLGAGRPAYLEKRRMLMAEAIHLVHRCGGIAILAHPGSGGTLERVRRLADLGLDGLEVLHPSHSAEDRSRLATLAQHFDLVPSGGSDSHGSGDGTRAVGAMHVPVEWLRLQEERAVRRRAAASAA